MPRRDGSGPMGRGPLTGWGMGPCCEDGPYAYGRRGRRVGYGGRRAFGRGFGGGYGRDFGPGLVEMPCDDPDDRAMLEEERQRLQERLAYIANRLEEE